MCACMHALPICVSAHSAYRGHRRMDPWNCTKPSLQLHYFFLCNVYFILLLIKEMNSSPISKVFIRNIPLFKDIADILVLEVEMLTWYGFVFKKTRLTV